MILNQQLKRKIEPYAFLTPTAIIITVLLIIPIAMVISYSFLNNAVVTRNPEFVGLENYVTVLSDSEFWSAIVHTIIFVSISVIGHLVIGMGFALLINSDYFDSTTKTIVRVIYFMPWIFTASVVAVLWKLMLQPQGIVNYLLSMLNVATKDTQWLSLRSRALLTVTVINIWSGYPFYMISILAGLQGIPGELFESATIDGAGKWGLFVHITIPQLKPILISIALLDFVWTIQVFAVLWMLTGGGPVNSTTTLSVYIYKKVFYGSEYAIASTAAVIVLILCSVVAFVYARYQNSLKR
ncbi:MAG: carbohydrate ABC transporter permease [Pleomorphochaeta sp.]